jgi:aromatic ring-opening dioxygenase catalytic subunit (LigB family)
MTKSSKKIQKKLKDANPERFFILVTGVPIKNLNELAHSLENMNDWVFNHHVNDSRNDFATWVNDVLKDRKLAQLIRNTKNIRELELIVLRYIVNS